MNEKKICHVFTQLHHKQDVTRSIFKWSTTDCNV